MTWSWFPWNILRQITRSRRNRNLLIFYFFLHFFLFPKQKVVKCEKKKGFFSGKCIFCPSFIIKSKYFSNKKYVYKFSFFFLILSYYANSVCFDARCLPCPALPSSPPWLFVVTPREIQCALNLEIVLRSLRMCSMCAVYPLYNYGKEPSYPLYS